MLFRHVRGVLVLLHLVAVVVLAVPSLRAGLDRSSWSNPTVRDEIEAWTKRLNAVGFSLTPLELEVRAYTFAREFNGVREKAVLPFEPYRRYVGIRQPWLMFVAPHRHPGRLEIDIEEDARWRPIYVARSDDADWNRTKLDHDRLRAAVFRYAWRRYRRTYRQFAAWIRDRVREDFPRATRVRIRFYRYRTLSPGAVRAGEKISSRHEGEIVLRL